MLGGIKTGSARYYGNKTWGTFPAMMMMERKPRIGDRKSGKSF